VTYQQDRIVGRCVTHGCGHKRADHDDDGTCLATIPLITGPRPCVCTGFRPVQLGPPLDPPATREA
jgi:hypothetical protein